jgi:hypothetical protein
MPIDYNCKLLPTQQKTIERIITDEGFLLNDFKWGTTDYYVSDDVGMGGTHYLSSELTYNIKEEYFYFKFNQAIKLFRPEFSPAPDQRFVRLSDWIKWEEIEHFIRGWLKLLKKQAEALGYLGKAIEFGFKDVKHPDDMPKDEKLNEDEIESIKVILAKIEDKIDKHLELEEDEREFTKAEFNEIETNIRKLDKSGSRKYIIGTILNLGLFLSSKINLADLSKLISAEVNHILLILSEGIKSLPS